MNAMFDWSPRTGFCVGDDVGALRRRNALAGQRGLVDLQRGGLDEPPVGADVVTGGEQHHVADDHLVGVDLDLGAVPAHSRRAS